MSSIFPRNRRGISATQSICPLSKQVPIILGRVKLGCWSRSRGERGVYSETSHSTAPS